MTQTKICPQCSAEYFAHIENCADCGAVLLLPEENKKVQEKKNQCLNEALNTPVVVREGSLNWMDELSRVLTDSGIPCTIQTDTGCNKGCCGNTCRLMVSAENAETAAQRVEDYYMELHPEIRTSREMMKQGKCPACGSPVNSDAVECPDCGLTLMIIE